MKKLSFLQNTILLVISNLITGSLAFIFSIILSREIGAHGVGLYQMVMPVYLLFICFTCGGTTTALSKVVSEQKAKGNIREVYKSITASIAFFSSWTLFISILIVVFAQFLSGAVLKDIRTYEPILIFVPALLCVTIGSILKGYFYGLQNTAFPAVIDIVEKAVRVIILITLVSYLKDYGLKYQVAGAVCAMTAGEFISVILLYLSYKKSYLSTKQIIGTPDNVFQIIVNVLKISVPLSLNGFLSTVLGTFIAVIIPRRLQTAGFSLETSLALFGKLSGMSLNIIMFPAIIIGAISTILVPVISEASTGKSMSGVNHRINSTIKVTTAIAAASAGLFFSMPNELGKLFYSRNDLGNLIFSLSFGVVFMYLEFTLFGILNGLGKQGVLLRNTIVMSVIDVTLIYLLLGIPEINIYGYAINFVISPLVGCILNYIEIRKATDTYLGISKILSITVSVALLEIIIIKNMKPIITGIFNSQSAAAVILIIMGLCSYTVIYYSLNLFLNPKQKK